MKEHKLIKFSCVEFKVKHKHYLQQEGEPHFKDATNFEAALFMNDVGLFQKLQ